MISGTRLYINLTNKCNTDCPFCCMYSGTGKSSFLSFDAFKKIIDDTENEFELQLEGGEPLLHKDIFLFMEYAISTGRCKKIIILSNGILLQDYIKRFIDIAVWNDIKLEFKVSINYHLLQTSFRHLEKLGRLLFATQYIENIDFVFNVRKRFEDTQIEDEIRRYGLYDKSNIFYLQSYGKLSDSKYEKPVIVQNIENWRIYASDGKCFEQDLIARSEHEKDL